MVAKIRGRLSTRRLKTVSRPPRLVKTLKFFSRGETHLAAEAFSDGVTRLLFSKP